MRRVVGMTAVLAALLAGCGAVPEAGSAKEPDGVTALGVAITRTDPQPSKEELRSLADSQVAFALDLFRRELQGTKGDLALGPGSLHTALSMILAGARGRTAREVATVLHADALGPRLHELNNALDRELRSRGDDPNVDVSIANRVWAAKGLALRAAFVETLRGAVRRSAGRGRLRRRPRGRAGCRERLGG